MYIFIFKIYKNICITKACYLSVLNLYPHPLAVKSVYKKSFAGVHLDYISKYFNTMR